LRVIEHATFFRRSRREFPEFDDMIASGPCHALGRGIAGGIERADESLTTRGGKIRIFTM
jgi:hypothetical protein